MPLKNADEHVLAVKAARLDQFRIERQRHLAVPIGPLEVLELVRHELEIHIKKINGIEHIRVIGIGQPIDLRVDTGAGPVDELKKELLLIGRVTVGIGGGLTRESDRQQEQEKGKNPERME